jgi:hypothetical protein
MRSVIEIIGGECMRPRTVIGISVALAAGCSGEVGERGEKGDRGPAGPASLLQTDVVEAGADCPFGGVAVKVGVDDNDNQLLEEAEVDTTEFVCNGRPGANSLFRVQEGPVDECSTGGRKLHVGTRSALHLGDEEGRLM